MKTPLRQEHGERTTNRSAGMFRVDLRNTSNNQDNKGAVKPFTCSTMEAYVEYSLIKGIVDGSIKTPDDLDQVTLKSGSAISPELFKTSTENKGFWMFLETNYRAPLHNVNDMIAAALAIRYYQLYNAKEPGNWFLKTSKNLYFPLRS